MKSLLFVTDIDQPGLAGIMPELRIAGGPPSANTAEAAAAWLAMPLPGSPAALRWLGEAGSGEPPGPWLACMDPVSLAADMRELHLLDDAPRPDEGESERLARAVLPSLADRGLKLHRPGSERWYVSAGAGLEFSAAAPAVVRARRVRDELPEGPDGAAIRALVNEIQMLWHEHPVNRMRATWALPPVNSVWFWGAGPAAMETPAGGTVVPPLYSSDALLAGLWRRLGGRVAAPPAPESLRPVLIDGAVVTIALEDVGPDTLRRVRRRGMRVVTRDGVASETPASALSALVRRWRRS